MFNSVKVHGTDIAEPLTEINTEQLCMNLVFVYYKRAFYTVSVIQVNKEQAGNERVRKVTLCIKFYSHQLMHFFIQLSISLLSYIKIT